MADRPRSPRTLMVADHLWDALSAMAAEMGTDRESLVNQALYTFARLNGFVVPGDPKKGPPSQAAVPGPRAVPAPPAAARDPGDREPKVQVHGSLLEEDAATSADLPNLSQL